MERGDEIMADKGFLIEDLVRPRGIWLNIPAFTGGRQGRCMYPPFPKSGGICPPIPPPRIYVLGGRSHLEPQEVMESRIASTRIHVERAIGRIKEFKILTHVQSTHTLPYVNEIFFVYATLTNFQEQLIK